MITSIATGLIGIICLLVFFSGLREIALDFVGTFLGGGRDHRNSNSEGQPFWWIIFACLCFATSWLNLAFHWFP